MPILRLAGLTERPEQRVKQASKQYPSPILRDAQQIILEKDPYPAAIDVEDVRDPPHIV